jgi:ribosomal protein S18 acetylase RimI-like enzyme
VGHALAPRWSSARHEHCEELKVCHPESWLTIVKPAAEKERPFRRGFAEIHKGGCMQIRFYRPSDLEALRALTEEAFEGVSIDHNIEAVFGTIAGRDWRWRKARHIDDDVAANAGGAFVAEEDGEIIGYITTRVDPEAGIGQIPNLAVAAAARNCGLGRQLIERALDYFRALGLTHAKIETLDQNAIGQHLYPACGFREVARQIHFVMDLNSDPKEVQNGGRD